MSQFLFATTTNAYPDSPLIPRHVLFSPTEVSQVQLSPDGTRVGFVRGDAGGRRGIHIQSLASPSETRALPDATGTLLTWRWMYSNDHILSEQQIDGERRLLVINLRGGDWRDLTPDASQSRIVKLSPRYPDELVISVSAGKSHVSLKHVSVTEPARKPHVFPEAHGFDRWYVDHEFKLRAARKPIGAGFQVFANRPNDRWELIANWGEPSITRLAGVVALDADGQFLTVVDNQGQDKAVLKEIDLSSGDTRIRLEDPLADLLWVGSTVDARTGAVEAVVSYFVRLRRHYLDPSLAEHFEFLESVHPGDVSFVDRSLDDRVWLVRFMTGGPFVYFAYDRHRRRTQRLFSDLSALDDYPLATRRKMVIPARDGLLLPCDLYLPPGTDCNADGRPDTSLPLVLYVHGGPWLGFEWNSWFTNRSFQLLCNRGYAVLRADFRGARGYGRRFMDKGDLAWGTKMHEDLLDLAQWASDSGVAAAERVAIWGWSYGGYATNACLAFAPDVFACGISMYGLSDLVSFVGDLEGQGRSFWCRRVGNLDTKEGAALLREHSPLFSADKVTKPLLITHGSLDNRAPKTQSDAFVAALVKRDHPVTYLVYPREPHDYREDASWRAFWAVAERFLHEHLGGRYEPYGDALRQAHLTVATGERLIPDLSEALRP